MGSTRLDRDNPRTVGQTGRQIKQDRQTERKRQRTNECVELRTRLTKGKAKVGGGVPCLIIDLIS